MEERPESPQAKNYPPNQFDEIIAKLREEGLLPSMQELLLSIGRRPKKYRGEFLKAMEEICKLTGGGPSENRGGQRS